MSDIEDRLQRIEEQMEILEMRGSFRIDVKGNDVPRVKKIRGMSVECTGATTKVKIPKSFNSKDEFVVRIDSVDSEGTIATPAERRIRKISGSEFEIISTDSTDDNIVNLSITELPKGR